MDEVAALASLDNALARNGEDCVLQRLDGTGNVAKAVTVRARVVLYRPQEISGSIIQGDSFVILSPTQIVAAQWPTSDASYADKSNGDKRVPRRDDRLIVQGRTRTVQAPIPYYVNGELVRIELQVRG